MKKSSEEIASECELETPELIYRCRIWVRKLCESGGRDWTLQVPVNKNEDPDCLIHEVCDRLEEKTSTLDTLKERVYNKWEDSIEKYDFDVGYFDLHKGQKEAFKQVLQLIDEVRDE